MKLKFLCIFFLIGLYSEYLFSQISNSPSGNSSGTHSQQYWSRAGNTNQNGANNIFGTRWNSDIFIMTNNNYTARFTHNNALFSITSDFGDGLRILAPAGNSGNLDLFTTGNNGQNETHVRWGGSGQISGQNNRFEILSTAGQGLWFNLVNSAQYYKFATQSTVHGFVGNNRYWRIGDQSEG